jgi:broad specificity phosphatase PhoE
MTGLFFIRHATTDMAGTFCGHSDPPINSIGQQQIVRLIATLHTETFDEIYSSDLRRAVETATHLSQAFPAPVITTSNLREIHFGDWESRTWAEIEQHDPNYARRWTEAFPKLTAPNGESFASFEDRVLQEVDHLSQRAETKRIAVLTHAGVMRTVLRRLLGYTDQQAWETTKAYCSSFECAPSMPYVRRAR